jgi:hypothetical protein
MSNHADRMGICMARKKTFDLGAIGKRLLKSSNRRNRFDFLLGQYGNRHSFGDLKTIAKHYTGHDPYAKTKGDIVKLMKNWQRNSELADDINRKIMKNKP